jgi:hypothetical protein
MPNVQEMAEITTVGMVEIHLLVRRGLGYYYFGDTNIIVAVARFVALTSTRLRLWVCWMVGKMSAIAVVGYIFGFFIIENGDKSWER